jgi:hypothetical protein
MHHWLAAVHHAVRPHRPSASIRLATHPKTDRWQEEVRWTSSAMPAIYRSQSRLPTRPLPSHPAPLIGRDLHKRPVDGFGRHPASPPVPSRPARPGVGRSESGAKFGRRPARASHPYGCCAEAVGISLLEELGDTTAVRTARPCGFPPDASQIGLDNHGRWSMHSRHRASLEALAVAGS